MKEKCKPKKVHGFQLKAHGSRRKAQGLIRLIELKKAKGKRPFKPPSFPASTHPSCFASAMNYEL
jgi:hypothetical protein